MKKAILLALSLFSSSLLSQSNNNDQEISDQVEKYIPSLFYQGCSVLGSVADLFLSRGPLQVENQKIFLKEVEKQKVGNRDIQIRNMGFLMRIVIGYNNALSLQFLNRIYVNEDNFTQLSDNAKRFLIAREIATHKQFHNLEGVGLRQVVQPLVLKGAWSLAIENNLGKKIVKEDVQGNNITVKEINSNYNACVYYPLRYALSTSYLSLIQLFLAQMSQRRMFNADKAAVIRAGIPVKGGIEYINYVYNPDTRRWPLYARMRFLVAQVVNFLGRLPIIKQHSPFLHSADDRTDALKAIG